MTHRPSGAGSIKQKKIVKIKGTSHHNLLDDIAVEEPLEVQIRYGPSHRRALCTVAVIMRTPGQDRALAMGFAFTEQIISAPRAVAVTKQSADGNRIVLELAAEVPFSPDRFQRNIYTTSSCGMCGKTSIDHISSISSYRLISGKPIVPMEKILRWPHLLAQEQGAFHKTGGMHACALIPLGPGKIRLHEDVGRHNALDKLIGQAFMDEHLPLSSYGLQLSGRASFELIQKAVMAGIPIVSALGAPSSLAIELAEEHGLTLLGFASAHGCNIYTGADRVSGVLPKP
ncbi:MAG: formate dehydrogenase accessory sulfurtransferase FdhD [Saprospiraceae bacterium]|nr:formate dehydrogenase accessory sulfurtransferase FdhD [Saprospiraceae bacterium]